MLRLRLGFAKRRQQQCGGSEVAGKMMHMVRQNTGPLVSCNRPGNTVVYQLDNFGAKLLCVVACRLPTLTSPAVKKSVVAVACLLVAEICRAAAAPACSVELQRSGCCSS